MWLAHLPDVVRHVGNFCSEDNVKKKKKQAWSEEPRESQCGEFRSVPSIFVRDFGVHPVRWLGLKQDK
jgi:hypothetical protein